MIIEQSPNTDEIPPRNTKTQKQQITETSTPNPNRANGKLNPPNAGQLAPLPTTIPISDHTLADLSHPPSRIDISGARTRSTEINGNAVPTHLDLVVAKDNSVPHLNFERNYTAEATSDQCNPAGTSTFNDGQSLYYSDGRKNLANIEDHLDTPQNDGNRAMETLVRAITN